MESKSHDTSDDPRKLSYEFLQQITNNFAEERKLGSGSFGHVFKGVLSNGEEVAVKILRFMPGISDRDFENEFYLLKMTNHPNIVRLLGFCNETEEVVVLHEGKQVRCEIIRMALCLEYVPNGSLGRLLSGEYLGRSWPIRYKIIKGICEGLQYLHLGLEHPILHLDLKPDNILLDKDMVPKIVDFGLTRLLIGEENTERTVTPVGTRGYIPPEFLTHGVISKEYDIFSLGVIITKIITGPVTYEQIADMSAPEIIENVHDNWRKHLQEIAWYPSLETDFKQVKMCIEIAIMCMDKNRRKRPTINSIVSKLDELENFHGIEPIVLSKDETLPWPSQEMDDQEREQISLEHILTDASAEPIQLRYNLLRKITNDFSRVIGSGGFGVVYMGLLRNGKVAVKKLFERNDFSDKQFENELICLIRVRHKNIVRFLGYCSDIQQKVVQYEGRYVLADVRLRFLCFEFVPNKSLHDFLKGESHEREWDTHYHLIEGICQGLRYLHIKERINHLDLKPENILLTADMVPKITDFGLSRCFGGDLSRIITKTICGTPGYIAPEYLSHGEISFKTDIFSLGIIIMKILRGSNDLSDFQKWHQSLDNDFPKVKRCIEIAQLCVDNDQDRRPSIDYIIDVLEGKEPVIEMVLPVFGNSRNNSESSLEQMSSDSMQLLGIDSRNHFASEANSFVSKLVDEAQPMAVSAAPSQLQRIVYVPKGPTKTRTKIRSLRSSEARKLLDVHPLELYFPFEPNKRIRCPVSLTNRTDHYVGVWISPTYPDTCFDFSLRVQQEHKSLEDRYSPLFQSIQPHSTLVASITMKEQQQPPPRDMEKLGVLLIAMGSEDDLRNLVPATDREPNMDSDVLKLIEELGGETHQATLTAIIDDPVSEAVIHQTISTGSFGDVTFIDVHPTETWILTGHEGGYVCIWNYLTQEKVMALQVTKEEEGMLNFFTHEIRKPKIYPNAYSAKFIARKKWLASGDGSGCVHVHSYTTKQRVNKFEAYHSKPVDSLVVHPTYTFLLSSSSCDRVIKLWDWDQGWVCTQTFDEHTRGVLRLTLNPRDSVTFASVSLDGAAMVWNIHSSDPITTLRECSYNVDYFFTESNRHFLLTCGDRGKCADIWDSKAEKPVHKLAVRGRHTYDVASHPTLPILVTRLTGGTVCLWNPSTYRLEKVVHLTCRPVDDIAFIGTKDIIRLVFGCRGGISICEINLPMERTD